MAEKQLRHTAEQIDAATDEIGNIHEVAKSGSYNDLEDKPTIPDQITEAIVAGWGFTKNTGTYTKPNGGIPKTDLASAVQTSLSNADTAKAAIGNATSPETLASLMAGIVNSGNLTVDANTITYNSIHSTSNGSNFGCPHRYGLLITIMNQNGVYKGVQIFFPTNIGNIYFRTRSSSGWSETWNSSASA